MINSIPGVDEARKQRLIKVLDIDPEWRMHQVSDGQRRRVQICVGLLRPFKVRQEQEQLQPALAPSCAMTTCMLVLHHSRCCWLWWRRRPAATPSPCTNSNHCSPSHRCWPA